MNLSVIIPVYNCEKYINRCLDSVIKNCDDENIEVIIVNDGSKDNSEKICLEYQSNDKRVKYFNQENQGVSVARNHGLSKASGEYITFLDSDDYFTDDWHKIFESVKDCDYDIIFGNYYRASSDGIRHFAANLDDSISDMKSIYAKYLFSTHINAVWGKFIKRHLVENLTFPVGVRCGEDALFVGSLLKRMGSFCCINEGFYVYFDNADSVTNAKKIYTGDFETLHNFKKEMFVSLKSKYSYSDDQFYSYALSDILYPVKQLASVCTIGEYTKFVAETKKYEFVHEILNKKIKGISLRDSLHKYLYKNELYKTLYLQLRAENVLKKILRKS